MVMSTGTQLLLQSIIRSAFPKNYGLILAFGYGSVAVPQHGRSAKNSQLDFILVVNDPLVWHTENYSLNPNHYSGLARSFNAAPLKKAVSKWPRPAVFYNPLITWHDQSKQFPSQVFKYGVVSYRHLMQDLLTWSDLYVAGRLHKPVAFVPGFEGPADFRSALAANLRSALAFSLLEHDLSVHKEDSLYHSLATISYRGDWRLYFGEDKRKIERIITGEPRRLGFRELYLPLLTSAPFAEHFDVAVPADLKEDICINPKRRSTESVEQLLNILPAEFCQLAAGGKGGESSEARYRLAEMPSVARIERLRSAAASIVRLASYRQTVLGVFSAGLSRSFVYSLAKFRKMLASLSA